MALVTFLGTPSMTFYRGSCAGCAETWRPGEARELSQEVAARLQQDYPGAFETAGPSKGAPKIRKAAVEAPGAKAPPTKKRAVKSKAKKGKA